MSQDFRGFLQQMQGCAVSVVTWDHARLLGTLASVADDCIRMTGVVLQDSHETGGWSDRLLIEDLLEDRGNQWPEIIIQRNLISTVTMVSDMMRSGHGDIPGAQDFFSGENQPLEGLDKGQDPAVQHASTSCDSVRLEVGSSVAESLSLANEPLQKFPIKDRITATRIDLEKMLGFQLQPFRIQSSAALASDQFRVLIHGIEVGRGNLMCGKRLAILSGKNTTPPPGTETIEPIFGLPAVWIDSEQISPAELSGCTVVDVVTVISTMLDHYVRKHAKELLTYEAVSAAVDQLRESHPITVANLIPHPVSLRTLFEVLRGLVAEGVVIHHILPILESVGRHVEHCESMSLLRSRVRSDIPLILCGPHLDENGFLPVIVVEKEVAREVFPDDSELQPDDSTLLTNFLDEVRRLAPPADSTRTPILLVPHSSRERIWAHCRSTFEDLLVLSPSEVPLGVRLKVLGNVSPESIGRLKPEPEDSPETLSEFWQRKPR